VDRKGWANRLSEGEAREEKGESTKRKAERCERKGKRRRWRRKLRGLKKLMHPPKKGRSKDSSVVPDAPVEEESVM
jgi:hypothetical protein